MKIARLLYPRRRARGVDKKKSTKTTTKKNYSRKSEKFISDEGGGMRKIKSEKAVCFFVEDEGDEEIRFGRESKKNIVTDTYRR